MRGPRRRSVTHPARAAGAAVALLTAVALVSVAPLPSAGSLVPQVAAAGLGAGGEYHPRTPQRIYDSRPLESVNEPLPGPKPATPDQRTFDIDLLGQGGIPNDPVGVLAVVVNITVTEPTGAGWLNAYGSGSVDAGLASIINFSANQTVPNLSIVRPGLVDGKLTIKLFSTNTRGTAHVIVDVFGWFSTSAHPNAGSRLVPISPGRLIDTRDSVGALGTRSSLPLTIRGATLQNGLVVPDSPDIVGVVLNLTGVNTLPSSTGTYLSVLPEQPLGNPSTSNVNLARSQIKPNMVIVPVGADGRIHVFNLAGATHLVVDVVGYLQANVDPATTRGRVVPLTSPFRVFDTREAPFGSVPLGPTQNEEWSFADFVSSVSIGGVPVGAQVAVIGNLTAAELKRQAPSVPASGFLTMYPADVSQPLVSNLNMVEGPPVPNMAILTYGSATSVRAYNLAGYLHYLFDASAVVLS